MKNFFAIKAGNTGYLKEMASLSGLTEEEIETIARRHSKPEKFAQEIMRFNAGN